MNGTRSAFSRVLAALAALTALGCSDESAPEEPPLPPAQPICDGTDNVRFTFSAWGGFGNYGGNFTAAYGGLYLAIDGHCNYWVGQEGLAGLKSGSLDLVASGALSDELHFGRYFTAEAYRPAMGQCLDGGAGVLSDGTGTLRVASCPGQPEPRIVGEASRRAGELARSLTARGERTWTRTRVIAQANPPRYPDIPQMRPALAWTAELDLAERAVDPLDVARGLPPDAGVLVEDAPTLVVLEQLRDAALRSAGSIDDYDLLVRDAEDRYFLLLLRDEPPAAVTSALLAAAARLYE